MTHTRPLASIATLRGSACRCQIFSSPHTGERGVLASSTGPFDGILISVVEFVRGSSTARMSERLDGAVDRPVRVQRWSALVGASRIAPPAGRQRPVPHRDHEVALDTGGTRRRFGIRAGGDPIGPIGERLALRPEAP